MNAESSEELQSIAVELSAASSTEILRWALARYSGSIVAACSFGGPSGMVLLDQLLELDRSVPVFYLDTGLLHEETYAHIQAVSARYGIAPIAVQAPLTLERQASLYGERLWESDPDRCCELRKVEAQRAFLRPYRAWISGIRRDQTATRSQTPVVEWDRRFELVKINPLAHWDERTIWSYIVERNVPYNPLHDDGFSSIGCLPCTAPATTENARSGRWPGHSKTECGLHHP